MVASGEISFEHLSVQSDGSSMHTANCNLASVKMMRWRRKRAKSINPKHARWLFILSHENLNQLKLKYWTTAYPTQLYINSKNVSATQRLNCTMPAKFLVRIAMETMVLQNANTLSSNLSPYNCFSMTWSPARWCHLVCWSRTPLRCLQS